MTTTTPTATGTWTVLVPTRAGFSVRNFGINVVRGTVAVTAGTLELDPTGRPVRLSGTLDPSSVDTGNPRRDNDLRGKRFLNVAKYPTMHVVADEFEPAGDGWRARAVLRVAGAEAPLWIDGTLAGRSGDRLAVTGRARLDRIAAGIRVPRVLVGRWVDLTISVQLAEAVH